MQCYHPALLTQFKYCSLGWGVHTETLLYHNLSIGDTDKIPLSAKKSDSI